MNVIKLQHGQQVRIDCYQHSQFTVGSCEGYAKQYNENPFAALKRNQASAKERPYTEYCIAWLNHNASVITNDAEFNQRKIAEFNACPVLCIGAIVEIEQRRYKLVKTHNDNVFCQPVGRAAYGHPKKTRYEKA